MIKDLHDLRFSFPHSNAKMGSSPAKKAQIPDKPFSATQRQFDYYTETDRFRVLDLDVIIKQSKSNLKPKMSWNFEYYNRVAETTALEVERHHLHTKKSVQNFFENKNTANWQDWDNSEEAGKLKEIESCLTLKEKLYTNEARKRKINDDEDMANDPPTSKRMRRYFMDLWTSSKSGGKASQQDSAQGQRDKKIQANFRKALIDACLPKHEEFPKRKQFWCPVLGGYLPAEDVRAAHIFPYEQGQIAMEAMFGDGNGKVPQLFGIDNGLLLSKQAGKNISDGKIVIVPDVADNPTLAEIDQWQLIEPKEYKIRLVNMADKDLDTYLPCDSATRTWRDLNGVRVQFSSNHRPRARYLYWQYCETILRLSWHAPKVSREDALKKNHGKGYWGTRGSFLSRATLLALIEELGHEYEHLMIGAAENEQDQKSDPTGLIVLNDGLEAKLGIGQSDLDDEVESDEEEKKREESDEDY